MSEVQQPLCHTSDTPPRHNNLDSIAIKSGKSGATVPHDTLNANSSSSNGNATVSAAAAQKLEFQPSHNGEQLLGQQQIQQIQQLQQLQLQQQLLMYQYLQQQQTETVQQTFQAAVEQLQQVYSEQNSTSANPSVHTPPTSLYRTNVISDHQLLTPQQSSSPFLQGFPRLGQVVTPQQSVPIRTSIKGEPVGSISVQSQPSSSYNIQPNGVNTSTQNVINGMTVNQPNIFAHDGSRLNPNQWPTSPISHNEGSVTPYSVFSTPLSPGGESTISSEFAFDDASSTPSTVKDPSDNVYYGRNSALRDHPSPGGSNSGVESSAFNRNVNNIVHHLELLDQITIPNEFQYRFDADLKMASFEPSRKSVKGNMRGSAEYLCTYPGVSWNTRMQSWLVYYEDMSGRKSKTFNPKRFSANMMEKGDPRFERLKDLDPMKIAMHYACAFAAEVRYRARLFKTYGYKVSRNKKSTTSGSSANVGTNGCNQGLSIDVFAAGGRRRGGGRNQRSRSAQPSTRGGRSTRLDERLCTKFRCRNGGDRLLSHTAYGGLLDSNSAAGAMSSPSLQSTHVTEDVLSCFALPDSMTVATVGMSPVMVGGTTNTALAVAATQQHLDLHNVPNTQKQFMRSLIGQVRSGNEQLVPFFRQQPCPDGSTEQMVSIMSKISGGTTDDLSIKDRSSSRKYPSSPVAPPTRLQSMKAESDTPADSMTRPFVNANWSFEQINQATNAVVNPFYFNSFQNNANSTSSPPLQRVSPLISPHTSPSLRPPNACSSPLTFGAPFMLTQDSVQPSTDVINAPSATDTSRSPFRACRRSRLTVHELSQPLWSPEDPATNQSGSTFSHQTSVPQSGTLVSRDLNDSVTFNRSNSGISFRHSPSGQMIPQKNMNDDSMNDVSLSHESTLRENDVYGPGESLGDAPLISREFGSSHDDLTSMMCVAQSSLVSSNGEEAVLSSNSNDFL